MKVVNDISECIGFTPILDLNDEHVPAGKKLLLKLEYFNPTFSVKDRTALGMVNAAMRSGKLKEGGTLIESTSGNLGKALAMLGAIRGFNVIVVVDPKVSGRVLNWYRALGAKVVLVDEPDENGGYQKARIRKVREMVAEDENAYWPNQYDNSDNPNYHFAETGLEILNAAVSNDIDTIVGSLSTGGHMSGIGRRIKREAPQIKMYAADVEGSCIFGQSFKPYLLNGLGLGWRSENTDPTVFDDVFIVSDNHAIETCRRLAKRNGLLLGGSSGLVIHAALSALRRPSVKRVLAVLPDTGVNYLDQIYDEEWRTQNGVKALSRDEIDFDLRRLSETHGCDVLAKAS